MPLSFLQIIRSRRVARIESWVSVTRPILFGPSHRGEVTGVVTRFVFHLTLSRNYRHQRVHNGAGLIYDVAKAGSTQSLASVRQHCCSLPPIYPIACCIPRPHHQMDIRNLGHRQGPRRQQLRERGPSALLLLRGPGRHLLGRGGFRSRRPD